MPTGGYTRTSPELRRVKPENERGRKRVKLVYVVLEAQYQSALTAAVKHINKNNDKVGCGYDPYSKSLSDLGWLGIWQPQEQLHELGQAASLCLYPAVQRHMVRALAAVMASRVRTLLSSSCSCQTHGSFTAGHRHSRTAVTCTASASASAAHRGLSMPATLLQWHQAVRKIDLHSQSSPQSFKAC